MKKITSILTVLIALTMNANAQIPNSGFENWETTGDYEEPTDWATMNPSCAGPFYSCTKSTDHYPTSVGSYSIRVENNTSLTQMTGGWGMAITDTMAYPFQPAFPIIGHPRSLTGYYKYNSLNNDSMFIRIVLFNNGTMLGHDTFVTNTTASTWTSFNLPLSTYTTADSATIYFSAFWPSSQTSGPKGNSVLYVDNLNFDSLITVGISDITEENRVSVYPNPFSSQTTLHTDHLLDNATLTVNNCLGQAVQQIKNISSQTVTLQRNNLPSGLYFLRLTQDNKVVATQKIVITD